MGTVYKIQYRELNYENVSLGTPFVFKSNKLKSNFDWFFKKGEKYPREDFINKNPYTFEMRNCHKHLKRHISYKPFLDQIEIFNNLFKNNFVSHIIFASPTNYSKNYGTHSDRMDVILHQSLGEIYIEFKDYKVICKLENDDNYLWIPRGTYHKIRPTGNRITNSFGVEGENPMLLY